MRALRLGGPHYRSRTTGRDGRAAARASDPGESAQPTEEELRNIRRASRAAASDAAWLEEQEIIDEELAGGGAGSSGAPAAPPPPPPTRTRKFPRGHKFHAGPRLLSLPLEQRWEEGGCTWVPPTWDICRKFNRLRLLRRAHGVPP